MNYMRLIIFTSLTILGGWILSSDLRLLILPLGDFVKISGILNIWSGAVCLGIGVYFLLFTLNTGFKINIPLGNPNKVIFVMLLIAVCYTLVAKAILSSKVTNYTHCNDLTKVSTRYISNTYARTAAICEQLVEDKSQ